MIRTRRRPENVVREQDREFTDVVQAKEAAFEYVIAVDVFPIRPPAKAHLAGTYAETYE